ncbi:PREDICTED: dolichol kinase EVAN-like [Camelina sativa]|uniref:Dolichol kinase EVAN-like n=1 Tax=Camelina sativa TaxID=90675 RepID=A0ABM0YX27_CAMSA|nr:PREDICTED: dolichol kinase EVAN-like [Camelina sativa]
MKTTTTTTATSFATGERVVVAVVVSRILLSLPLSLISHGFSLFLLCFSAFLVEIRAESSPFLLSRFSARRGASSGILLGAVTLPAVMMSKLVQLTRAISIHEAEQDELAHVTMQYWAVVKVFSHSSVCFFHSMYITKYLPTNHTSSCMLPIKRQINCCTVVPFGRRRDAYL